ncbi:hypothetical protein QVD17_19825 [Tagetes erecta]|uniref:Uncharacterized protein n=1 Tax=Tagetes erecta TaxID=13708 RepID=A0AAD8KRL9_TARER|nr:hypothetical protein QVD17_19825 [Tagetes erecta]
MINSSSLSSKGWGDLNPKSLRPVDQSYDLQFNFKSECFVSVCAENELQEGNKSLKEDLYCQTPKLIYIQDVD